MSEMELHLTPEEQVLRLWDKEEIKDRKHLGRRTPT